MGLMKVVLLALFAVVFQHIFRLLWFLDFNKHVYDHEPGPCKLVNGIENGSEDIVLLANGAALISSGLKYGSGRHNPKINSKPGQIFYFDFNNPTNGTTPLKIEGRIAEQDPTVFAPHGMSVWEDEKTGRTTLFVVNHPLDKSHDTVEKFAYDRKRNVLVHEQTITDENFRYTNDLIATGPNSFYITNNIYSLNHVMQKVETYGRFSWGSIAYYDGQKAKIVADQLHFPNGIEQSKDGRWIYVASPNARQVAIFERRSDNSLDLKREIEVYTSIDNLFLEPTTGDLWGGAHPVPWEILLYLDDHRQTAPSQVLRMTVSGDDVTFVEEVLSDPGRRLYGSTIAVYRKGALLVGTVYHKLLYCEVRHLA